MVRIARQGLRHYLISRVDCTMYPDGHGQKNDRPGVAAVCFGQTKKGQAGTSHAHCSTQFPDLISGQDSFRHQDIHGGAPEPGKAEQAQVGQGREDSVLKDQTINDLLTVSSGASWHLRSNNNVPFISHFGQNITKWCILDSNVEDASGKGQIRHLKSGHW